MGITTTRWDSAEHLQTKEDIQLYLEASLDEAGENPLVLIHALSVIARAKNLESIDKEVEEVSQVTSPESSPTFAMVAKLVNSLGFRLTVEPLT